MNYNKSDRLVRTLKKNYRIKVKKTVLDAFDKKTH